MSAKVALSVVESFSVAAPGGIRFQLDVDAAPGSADTGDIKQDLADLLVEIGEVARAGGTGALLLIDEMQNLDEATSIRMRLKRNSARRSDMPARTLSGRDRAACVPFSRRREFVQRAVGQMLFRTILLDAGLRRRYAPGS